MRATGVAGMEYLSFGVIEIVVVFGGLLAVAAWELRRTKRQLKGTTSERDRTKT